jgi:DNA-binding response OmpR family regulator
VRGKRILLIEDNEDTRAFVRTVARLEGADLTMASTGEEGLAVLSAAEEPFDLIVLDVNLPGIAGWDVLDDVRQRDFDGEAPPVVLFTALNDSETSAMAERLGAAGMITKPVGAKDLVDQLKKYLG